MISATEQLKSLIVTNPGITLSQGDVCFYMAHAQIGKPYNKTTAKTKSGLGVGVTVPITKHFGLGLFSRKATTEVITETKWRKTPCTLYVLCEKFAFSIGKDVYYIDNEEIAEISIHKDALAISSKTFSFYMLMNARDIKRFQCAVQLIQQAQNEGATMSDFGYVPYHQAQTQHEGTFTINTNKIDVTTAQSDYAKTIFIWALSRKASTIKKRDEYPSYCFYELGIQNPKEYHKHLIENGYFEDAKDTDILDTLKIDKLKEILTEWNLETKGKKDVLIQRIVENTPSVHIASLMCDKLYIISKLGLEFIASHDDYVKLHQYDNWCINYQEFDAEKAKNPVLTFFDVCWGIFNSRIHNHKCNMDSDRNEYYNMYQLLELENRKERATELLLRVFYIDVNSSRLFAPSIIKEIGEHEEWYNPAYVDKLYTSELPRMSCDTATFKSIVESIIRGDFSEDAFQCRLK